MKKVELAPGVHSSILGFGCAPILGAVDGKTAHRALAEALDLGVTHFDVARSYGYGEAEAFLGRFFAGRRDQVTLASKFGIQATWKAALARPLKPLVRALKSRSSNPTTPPPNVPEPIAPPRRDPFHQKIPLTPQSMRNSLEKSLHALRTDYLDLFFLHEPPGPISQIEDLWQAANELKQEGKIKAWGLAYNHSTQSFHAPVLDHFDLLQFDTSPSDPLYPSTQAQRRNKANVFFSPFRRSPQIPHAEILKCLWTDFPKSVVLCSMFKPEHIRANTQAAHHLTAP